MRLTGRYFKVKHPSCVEDQKLIKIYYNSALRFVSSLFRWFLRNTFFGAGRKLMSARRVKWLVRVLRLRI